MRDNTTSQIFKGTGANQLCLSGGTNCPPTSRKIREQWRPQRVSPSPRQLSTFRKKASFMLCGCRSRSLSAVLKTKIMSLRPTKVLCRCKNGATAIRINVTIRISLQRVGFNLATFFSFLLHPPRPPQINTRADLQMPFLCPLSVPCTWTHVCPSDIIWPQFVTAGSVESRIVLHLPCVLCTYETHPIWRTNVHVVFKRLALLVDFFNDCSDTQ